ncbi:MAG: substrate-binding domain-containing protein, partial [Pseudomonadota bacterium]
MKQTLILTLLTLLASAAHATDQMRMAVTTSFHNSGLADVLLPEIAADLDLEVQLLVVGTGQALRLGEAGDVDAILVHSRAAEEAFVADGYGTHRREIMYNDFVLPEIAADLDLEVQLLVVGTGQALRL